MKRNRYNVFRAPDGAGGDKGAAWLLVPWGPRQRELPKKDFGLRENVGRRNQESAGANPTRRSIPCWKGAIGGGKRPCARRVCEVGKKNWWVGCDSETFESGGFNSVPGSGPDEKRKKSASLAGSPWVRGERVGGVRGALRCPCGLPPHLGLKKEKAHVNPTISTPKTMKSRGPNGKGSVAGKLGGGGEFHSGT